MIARLALALLLLATPATAQPPLPPVQDFDVQRYLGTWQQIATIPAWFQDQCVAATTATYTAAAEPGRIGVLNACTTADGTRDRAVGTARFTGPPDEGALEVTFVEVFGRPLWLAAGAYVVIALGPDYAWSAVAHPSRDYGWILAREPELDAATLVEIEAVFADAGYDTCRLLMTPPTPVGASPPLCEVVAAD